MGTSVEETIKEIQGRENIFVAYSQTTKLPYVTCGEESFNDQAWFFTEEEAIKEFTIQYEGTDINICVVSGLANAHEVFRRMKAGEANYHLIEVMACKGGCVMGGGQPVKAGECVKSVRTEGLYEVDTESAIKVSDDNADMEKLYAEFLNGKTHELLHNEGY